MDKGNERKNGAIGGGPLLMAAVSLCLAMLAMLGAYQASAHEKLSAGCAAEAAAWYGACLEADRELAALRADAPDGTVLWFSEEYPISDTQALQVGYSVLPDGSYEIERWQSVPAGEWEEVEFIEGIN